MTAQEIGEFARNIIHGAETLNQRFENFLLYSRIQSGLLVINPPRETNVKELLAETAGNVAGRHHRINTLRTELAEVTAKISQELMVKAVAEIIDNACRYSLAGEPIDIALTQTEAEFSINISDYGMGIGQDQLQRLAEESVVRGCGMLLSQKLTEALGGKWELDNQPKQGAKFVLTFPLTSAT